MSVYIRREPFIFYILFVLIVFVSLLAHSPITPSSSAAAIPKQHATDDATTATQEDFTEEIRSHLCPNMVPNLTFASTLFWLARNEIILPDNDGNQIQKPTNESYPSEEIRTFREFYGSGFSRGATTFTNLKNKKTLFYLRMWKVANNQIQGWLKGALGDKARGKPVLNTNFKNRMEQFASHEEDLCAVAVLRDPLDKFVSAYNEILYRNVSRRMHKYQYYGNNHKQKMESFHQFVSDFVQYPGKLNLLKGNGNHLSSMVGPLYIMNAVGVRPSKTHYLPTLKNLTVALPPFLAQACPQSFPQELANATVPLMGQHESSKDLNGYYRAAKDVVATEGPTARALCLLSAMDYACWGKLVATAPPVCQRVVFSNPNFVQHLQTCTGCTPLEDASISQEIVTRWP